MIPNFRKINNFGLEKDYNNIINYKQNKQLPDNLSNSQKTRFIKKYKNFKIKDDNKLFYDDLEVIKKADIDETLKPIYNDISEGFGHGIKQFYDIITSKYLNITRKDINDFLKKQINYQLTFKPQKRKEPVKKFNKPNEAYALDLIDIHRYKTFNKNYAYILTMIDVYNSHIWLRPLKTKNANEVYNVLKSIFDIQKPKLIIMDNGGEFQGINKDLFKEFNIKISNTPSHTPQANIENLNGQIRKFLSQLFVYLKKTTWINHIKDIEDNFNSYNSLPKNEIKRNVKNELTKNNDNVIRPLFKVGDIVRINQKIFEPFVRQQYKANQQKYSHVKYSIQLFEIFKVYKPYRANSLSFYILKDEDGYVINNDNNNQLRRFKENDLISVKSVVGENLTKEQNNKLNGINY